MPEQQYWKSSEELFRHSNGKSQQPAIDRGIDGGRLAGFFN
jgi:hypothetical protein